MLRRLFEWYRLVSPTPSDDLVEKRTAAVADLLEKLSGAADYDLLVACTAAATNGLETGFEQTSELVQGVIECIRNHQPAFPEDLSENALDLRACCAVAVGEVLIRDEGTASPPDNDAKLAASLIVTALGLRPRLRQRYLQSMIDELHVAALATMQRAAEAQRERQSGSSKRLESVKVAATAQAAATTTAAAATATGEVTAEDIDEKLDAFWLQLMPVLQESFASIERQAAADREELEVLWWLYNGYSEELKKPLVNLKPGAAAISCGVEVADRVVVPPLGSIRQMVLQAADKNRKQADTVAKPLRELIEQWEPEISSLLMPSDGDAQQLLREYPALLPLSWLGLRLHEGGHAAGWNQEFEAKTGAPLSHPHKPAALAVQAFNERVARRLYLSLM